jgi:hypothetical protein
MKLFVVSLVLVLATPVASAEPCRATALLEGDDQLVDALDAALHRRGIETTARAECPAARARITRRGSAIAVSVVDPDGRSSERSLANLDAAASLIESWARQDLNAPLLVGKTYESPTPGPSLVVPAAAVARARDPFSLVAAGETSFDLDGATWFGARATGCGRIGPTCVGVTGRLLSADPSSSYDVLASVDLPVPVTARIAVVAGAGVGAGWLRAVDTSMEASPLTTTLGLRTDGHAALSFALGAHVALHLGISLGTSTSSASTRGGEGQPAVTTSATELMFRGDVGLRIGVP